MPRTDEFRDELPSDEFRTEAFRNEQVDPGTLPDWRTARLHGVAPAFVPYAILATLLFWGGVALVAFTALRLAAELSVPRALLTAAPILLAAGWFAALALLDAKRRGWAVREHDLIYRSGVIWQRTTILPFARIQHVETTSGPLERAFGLLRMKCFTAGGAAGDLTVKGLDAASAKRVRAFLLQQIRDDADADAGAEQPARDGVDRTDKADPAAGAPARPDEGRSSQ